MGECTKPIVVAQVMRGEQNNIGTGCTVWASTPVLIRYLQHNGLSRRTDGTPLQPEQSAPVVSVLAS